MLTACVSYEKQGVDEKWLDGMVMAYLEKLMDNTRSAEDVGRNRAEVTQEIRNTICNVLEREVERGRNICYTYDLLIGNGVFIPEKPGVGD